VIEELLLAIDPGCELAIGCAGCVELDEHFDAVPAIGREAHRIAAIGEEVLASPLLLGNALRLNRKRAFLTPCERVNLRERPRALHADLAGSRRRPLETRRPPLVPAPSNL